MTGPKRTAPPTKERPGGRQGRPGVEAVTISAKRNAAVAAQPRAMKAVVQGFFSTAVQLLEMVLPPGQLVDSPDIGDISVVSGRSSNTWAGAMTPGSERHRGKMQAPMAVQSARSANPTHEGGDHLLFEESSTSCRQKDVFAAKGRVDSHNGALFNKARPSPPPPGQPLP